MKNEHVITLDHCQSDMVLMALAHLSVERPGWDYALRQVAAMLDEKLSDGRLRMFEDFKRMHDPSRINFPAATAGASGKETAKYKIDMGARSIVCKKCNVRSYNLNDVKEKYCGFCKVFHDATPA